MTDYNNENINYIENAKKARDIFMGFIGFLAAGVFIMELSLLIINSPLFPKLGLISALLFLGSFVVMAMPCLAAFVFRFGIFYDMGEVFHTTQTRIGNIIYLRPERDFSTQYGGNVILTIAKFCILTFLAFIITPIVTIVLYITYKKSCRQAIEAGAAEEEIPKINKALVRGILIGIAAFFAVIIVVSNVTDAVDAAKSKAEKIEAEEKYAPLLKEIKIPDEYFADTTYQVYGKSEIAYFKLNGEAIYCGKAPESIRGKFEGIDYNSEYFIIGDKLYVDYSGIGEYEEINNPEAKDALLERYIDKKYTADAEYLRGGEDSEKIWIRYMLNDTEYCITADKDNNIIGISEYYDEENPDKEIEIVINKEADLSEYKQEAEELMKR